MPVAVVQGGIDTVPITDQIGHRLPTQREIRRPIKSHTARTTGFDDEVPLPMPLESLRIGQMTAMIERNAKTLRTVICQQLQTNDNRPSRARGVLLGKDQTQSRVFVHENGREPCRERVCQYV